VILNPLESFASRFGGKVALNPEFIVQKENRCYLLNPAVRKVAKGRFFYAGLFLGKVEDSFFFPSFNFLNMLMPVASNKIVLDRKAAWLFICGRDLFSKGIVKAMGSKRSGDFTLVLNEFGECLGFGVFVENWGVEGKVLVRNVLDVGDFLRRER
jgi:ribosome biogenesis protein Nip4